MYQFSFFLQLGLDGQPFGWLASCFSDCNSAYKFNHFAFDLMHHQQIIKKKSPYINAHIQMIHQHSIHVYKLISQLKAVIFPSMVDTLTACWAIPSRKSIKRKTAPNYYWMSKLDKVTISIVLWDKLSQTISVKAFVRLPSMHIAHSERLQMHSFCEERHSKKGLFSRRAESHISLVPDSSHVHEKSRRRCWAKRNITQVAVHGVHEQMRQAATVMGDSFACIHHPSRHPPPSSSSFLISCQF